MQSFTMNKTPCVAFSTSSDTVGLIYPEKADKGRLAPGEYVALPPYWYRIQEDTWNLIYLGKTSQPGYNEQEMR